MASLWVHDWLDHRKPSALKKIGKLTLLQHFYSGLSLNQSGGLTCELTDITMPLKMRKNDHETIKYSALLKIKPVFSPILAHDKKICNCLQQVRCL